MTSVAIDFGLSFTDCVRSDGQRAFTKPSRPQPDADQVRHLLQELRLTPSQVRHLAVTGGRHAELPESIDSVALHKVNEVDAIGAVTCDSITEYPALVLSCGTGTACVLVEGPQSRATHLGGTAVGGGTLLGLGHLLLGTTDARQINGLAADGDPAAMNLTLGEVVSGPIGTLPPDATASNFGKITRRLAQNPADSFRPEDVAAALIVMVAETISRVAAEAARGSGAKSIFVVGRTASLPRLCEHMMQILGWADLPISVAQDPGRATARGALALALARDPGEA